MNLSGGVVEELLGLPVPKAAQVRLVARELLHVHVDRVVSVLLLYYKQQQSNEVSPLVMYIPAAQSLDVRTVVDLDGDLVGHDVLARA